MSNNEYKRDLVKKFEIREIGETLHIESADFESEKIDYSNEDRMKILATAAVNTADGFYDLIKSNLIKSDLIKSNLIKSDLNKSDLSKSNLNKSNFNVDEYNAVCAKNKRLFILSFLFKR